ncbi:MAG: neuromedin U [Alphaproteobacteria bacterium]|nr:neuromedin U [Alphaproteobacteria bacterium]
MLPRTRYSSLYIFLGFLCFLPAYAKNTSDLELLKDFENPLSNIVSIPLQNDLNFGFADKDQPQYILKLIPQIPIRIYENIKVITRPILPIYSQVNILTQRGHIFGIGDFNPQFYLAHVHIEKTSVGIGPLFSLPTATNRQLGSGKVSAGPGMILATTPGKWVLGFYANNLWSFAGSKNQPRVNTFNLEAFSYYNLSNGWYIASLPQITADWTLKHTQRWTVPVGGGGGYVFKVNKHFVSGTFQAFYNVAVPSSVGTKWTARFTLNFFFPE